MLYLSTHGVLWWHWTILGLGLLIAEIFSGTFIFLGVGIGAICVGVLDAILNLSFTAELLLLLIFSIGAIVLLFKFFKDTKMDSSGQSDYAIGAEGVVEESIPPHGRGKVRFNTPILGNTIWFATAQEAIPISTKVKITAIKGQLIEVKKI